MRGRRRDLGFGAVAIVTLAEARELPVANRKLARSGGHPLSEKRCAELVTTFAEAAERVLERKPGGWRGRRHAQWRSLLLNPRRKAYQQPGLQSPLDENSGAGQRDQHLDFIEQRWRRKRA